MTDATTHGHAHDHDRDHDHAGAEHIHTPLDAAAGRAAATGRVSMLEAPALARLGGLSLVLAALWAGVYWALH